MNKHIRNIKHFCKSNPYTHFFYKYIQHLIRSQRLHWFLKVYIYRYIDQKIDRGNLKINIGAGPYYQRHWRVMEQDGIFTDGYRFWSGTIDYPHNLTEKKPFPLTDNCVSLFFTSHTLEHIPMQFCHHIFSEIYRCLKIGGAIRLTMPDFDAAYAAYGNANINFFTIYPGSTLEEKFLDFFATHLKFTEFVKEVQVKYSTLSKVDFANYFTSKIPLESQKNSPGNHLNWWNYEKLNYALAQAGFHEVYRSQAQQSQFPEMRGGGFDSTHPEISLFVEAIKK